MTVDIMQLVLLGDQELCSAQHLADVSGLALDELAALIDNGVIEPVDRTVRPPVFHLRWVVTANTARRLRDDFELDSHGLILALTLLRRVAEAETELQALRAQLGRRSSTGLA